MNRLKLLCVSLAMLLTAALFTGFLANPAQAASQFDLRLGAYDESLSCRLQHALNLLLEDMDIATPVDEDIEYANSGAGSFEFHGTPYQYKGTVSLHGKLVDRNQLLDNPGPQQDIHLVGTLSFSIELTQDSRANLLEEKYEFSGPFTMNSAGMLEAGIDNIEVFRADRVKGSLWSRSQAYVPDQIRIYHDGEDDPFYYGYYEMIPLYEMLLSMQEELALDQAFSFSYSASVQEDAKYPERFLGGQGTLEFTGQHAMSDGPVSAPRTQGVMSYVGEVRFLTGDGDVIRRVAEFEADTVITVATMRETANMMIGSPEPIWRTINSYDSEGNLITFGLYRSTEGVINISSLSVDYKYDLLTPRLIPDQGWEHSSELDLTNSLAALQFSLILPSDQFIVIDTIASRSPGETPISIPVAIVLGFTGLAAAVAGAAGAAGAAAEEAKQSKSTFKMVLYKEFGDTIEYNGETVYVYARMVEVTEAGQEKNRPDLTRQIEIFSGSPFLDIAPAGITGDYMGTAVRTVLYQGPNAPSMLALSRDHLDFCRGSVGTEMVQISLAEAYSQGIISFRFSGAGGTFQNNVAFNMSARDWNYEAKLRFEDQPEAVRFSIEKHHQGAQLTITEFAKYAPSPTDPNVQAEIIVTGRSPLGEDSRIVRASVWQEGLYLTRTSLLEGVVPIKSNLEPEDPGRATPISIFAVVWDEEAKTARFDIDMATNLLFDKVQTENPLLQAAAETIGMDIQFQENRGGSKPVRVFNLAFKDSIPAKAEQTLYGTLTVWQRDQPGTFKLDIPLSFKTVSVPGGSKDWLREYENCRQMIIKYLPTQIMELKLRQLEHCKDRMGVSELVAFRHEVFEIVCEQLEMERRYWMEVSAWHDKVIYRLDWVVWAGDRATKALAVIFLTPFGAAVASAGKRAFTSFIDELIKNWNKPIMDTFQSWAWNNAKFLTDMTVDELLISKDVELKDFKKPKWIALYLVYKFSVHLAFDDDNGKSIGFYEAAKRAAQDLLDAALDKAIEGMLKGLYEM